MDTREFLERPLAITDFETTGIDEQANEIIELGLLVVDQKTLEVQHEFEAKIKPEHIETASEVALRINGYNEEDWRDAEDLSDVMGEYNRLTKGAMLESWNYHFEAKFLDAACRKAGLPVGLEMDYHMRGVETLASELLRNAVRFHENNEREILQRENMKFVAEFLGTGVEPDPHNALEGAKCAYRVYKRLREIVDSFGVRFQVFDSGDFVLKTLEKESDNE